MQGGSSITQQVAKNLFLSSERSVQRKIKEVFLALLLESRFSKRDILKLYFDRAYMGGGAFGVEAASQYYFGKSVRQVNLAEAAMLAGLFKAPTKYAPHVNLPASRARTNEVLNNLVEAGFYTAGQVHWARVHPAKTIENRNPNSPDWFLDWAFEEVQRIAAGRGSVCADRTHHRRPQHAEDDGRGADVGPAPVSRQPHHQRRHRADGNGRRRARVVGGPDYGESQFNRATHARRQPGSSFKVYVYAAALENGYTPTTSVRDASRSCGRWHPQNYGGSHGGGGRMPLWMALAKSLNTVAAELSFAVGRDKVIEMTQPRRRQRHPQDLLDGARRLRHQPARACRRHRHVRQWRQARQALRHSRARQLARAISSTAATATSRRPRRSSSARSPRGLTG